MELESIVRRWELEQLFTDYVHCLDADELERWPDFFTEDCFYRITSAENYDAGLPLGLIYATSRNMLKDRVSALREANVYEPQRYRHLVSSIRIPGDAVEGPEHVNVVANFLVVRTMQDGEMTIFGAGRYLDRVSRDSGGGSSRARLWCSTAVRSTRCWRSRSNIPFAGRASGSRRWQTALISKSGSAPSARS